MHAIKRRTFIMNSRFFLYKTSILFTLNGGVVKMLCNIHVGNLHVCNNKQQVSNYFTKFKYAIY